MGFARAQPILVLAQRVKLGAFREEWPGPGGTQARRRSSDRDRSQRCGLPVVARSRSALHRTWMVEGTLGSHHKEGSRKMSKHSMICAGIDTGKRKLDVAIKGQADELQVDNSLDGHGALSGWLRQRRVKRVGIEASGGYEQAVVAHLRRDKFVVVVFQRAQVRVYAQFHLQRAKNDKIDAALIADCTAAVQQMTPRRIRAWRRLPSIRR